jgi:methylaspartate ammonia-lyase
MKRVVSYGAELDKRTNEVAKKTQKLADEYKKIIDDFTKFRVALQKDLIQTKIPDQENLDDRERDIIITRSRNLLDSASFVEDRLSKGHANVKQAIFD